MSNSTVSITGNPAARRRPATTSEKKSGAELVSDEGVPTAGNGSGGGGMDDNVASGGLVGKDLSHSIRGEVVLERSRDSVQVKKITPNSNTALPRRTTKKGVLKSDKTFWQTVLSVLTKNLLLLLALLGFVQMVRKLAVNSGAGGDSSTVPSSAGAFDFEGRIAEMESNLKLTTKMMQVRVDVVDSKINNAIGGLRKEISKKIEDSDLELTNKLKKLDERNENLEKYLNELRSKDLLTKEDLDNFLANFGKAKGLNHGEEDVSLDDIRAFARKIVEAEIEKHAADGLGRVDYALASGGAFVVKHSDPLFVGKGVNWLPISTWKGDHHDPQKMIRPSFGEPGQCFPLKGSSGFVQIKLRTAIIPEAITLEHVAKSVAYDRSSAPKDCRVSGWLQGHDATDLAADSEKMFLLTEFTYDLEKSNVQTFNVIEDSSSSAGSGGAIDTVRFDFSSNHGSASHTCIYRLRVHGREVNSISMLMTKQQS